MNTAVSHRLSSLYSLHDWIAIRVIPWHARAAYVSNPPPSLVLARFIDCNEHVPGKPWSCEVKYRGDLTPASVLWNYLRASSMPTTPLRTRSLVLPLSYALRVYTSVTLHNYAPSQSIQLESIGLNSYRSYWYTIN